MCDHCQRYAPESGVRLYPIYQVVSADGEVLYSAVCRSVARDKAAALGCDLRLEPRQDDSTLPAAERAKIEAIYGEGV